MNPTSFLKTSQEIVMTESRVSLNEYESKRVGTFEGVEPELPVSKIVSLVPQLTSITEGNMLVQYVVKDEALIFHIYNTDRKQLRDEAIEVASSHADDTRYLNQLNTILVNKLADIPWPKNMEGLIRLELFDFYRDQDIDVSYVPEMDSWSVLMRKPVLPTATSVGAVQLLVKKLSQSCFGAKQ
jgi:hypothetical protein